ncbi:MAG TPA: hypothetical protein VFE53_23390 [Mucilaginibacter sp.]|jgi:hypothetical protein|nr:hypothetical protein [Mucilaginibacter sp.]
MNYNISFKEMDKLAQKELKKQRGYSLEEMRKQVTLVKSWSVSKEKKQQG